MAEGNGMLKTSGLRTPSGKSVPLKELTVKVSIKGFVADVTSTFNYVNKHEDAVEGIFTFPLEENSAVYKFECTADDIKIETECYEKGKAKEKYEHMVKHSETSLIFEDDDYSGRIFRTRLGSLPPKKNVTIQFCYMRELDVDIDGRVKFVLPTAFKPQSATGAVQLRTSKDDPGYPPPAVPEKLQFTAHIEGQKNIVSVDSVSGDLVIDLLEGNKSAQVELKETFNYNNHISFYILYEDCFDPSAIFEKGVPGSHSAFQKDVVMINYFPDLKRIKLSSSGEYIFIVDRSGSMSGDRIQSARDTLLLFLKSLPVGCYFNVIGFGSRYNVLFSNGSKQYDKETLSEAKEYQRSMQADMGGTEIIEPLEEVYSNETIPGRPRQIFLLTDGAVADIREVLELVSANASNTRVFAVGIGDGASKALVRGIARAGRGKAEFVSGNERLQSKVMMLVRWAMQPSLNQVEVRWESTEGLKPVLIPRAPPTIFFGEKLVLFAQVESSDQKKIDNGLSLVLSGKMNETDVKFSITPTCPTESNDFSALLLHRMTVKQQIKDYQDMERDILIHEPDLKAKVINLSTATNVNSWHTSLAAIDKERQLLFEENCLIHKTKSSHLWKALDGTMHVETRMFKSSGKEQSLSRSAFVREKRKTVYRDMVKYDADDDVGEVQMRRHRTRDDSDAKTMSVAGGRFQDKLKRFTSFFQKKPRGPFRGKWAKQVQEPKEPEPTGTSIMRPKETETTLTVPDDHRLQNRASMEVNLKMMGVIDLQHFDGSWSHTDELLLHLEVPEAELKKVKITKDDTVLATVATVVWLRTRCPAKREEWELIEDKAVKWLQAQDLSGRSVEEFIEAYNDATYKESAVLRTEL